MQCHLFSCVPPAVVCKMASKSSQHQGYLCKHTPVLPALVPAAMACQLRLSQFGHFIVHVIPLLCDLLCFFLYLCAQILIHVRFFLHDL